MAFENLKSTGITYVLTKLKDYFLQIKDAVKSVNGELPDEDGDITLTSVPYAGNLQSESSHRDVASFIQRTTGGGGSVNDGEAWLMKVKGDNVHEGFVEESIDMTVTALGETPITATLNRDTFVAAVSESGTILLAYSTDWSTDPATYGITVTGTPESGDQITIVYVKEERGSISVTNPQSFISTGWNLYDNSVGYAKVVKYGYGYRISGTYTAVQYSATLDGTKSTVSVNDGYFDIGADGYIWVTGGNSTDTAVYATWEDWTDGYDGDFEAYSASEVDLSSVMSTHFPYGLLKAGSVVDEIDLNLGQAISRVERMAYSAANRATAEASGREYEFDEDYIYLTRATASVNSISIDGAVNTSDHGIEYFTYTDLPIKAEILYGVNLKNKLERDVLTISSQTLTDGEKSQVRNNLGLGSASTYTVTNGLTRVSEGAVLDGRQGKILNDKITSLAMRNVTWTYSANAGQRVNTDLKTLIDADLPSGYKCLGIIGSDSGNAACFLQAKYISSQYGLSITNTGSSAVSNQTATVYYLCIKTS